VSDLIRGNQLLRSGKIEEAVAAYQSAIAHNPSFHWSHYRLGEALEKLGRWEDAIVAYRKALELKPDSSLILFNLSRILKQVGQVEEVEKLCKQAVELQKSCTGQLVLEIQDAIIKPISIKHHFEWVGGLCLSGIPEIFRHRRWNSQKNEPFCIDIPDLEIGSLNHSILQNDAKSRTFYKGTYIYAGPLYTHFGHTLTESIHRLWAFNPRLHDGIIFAVAQWQSFCLSVYHPSSWLTQILEILEIPLSKCIFLTHESIVENCIIPEPGSELTLGPKEWYRPHLDKLQERILTLTQTLRRSDSDLKLFLGRNHIPLQGGVAGEKYFEEILLSEGYTSIIPEKYNILEQLSYLVSAKQIVFTEGSAIYSLELLNYLDADILCIPRRPYHEHFLPHLIGKCSNYIIGGHLENVVPLGSYSQDAVSIAILDNPDDIVESLRIHDFASFQGWNKDNFLSQEQLDVITYINGGFTALKGQNISACFALKKRYIEFRGITDKTVLQNFSNFLQKFHLTDGKRLKLDNFVNIGLGQNVDVFHDLNQGIPEDDSLVSLIYTEHFIEQLDRPQIMFLLRECKRVLDSRGKGVLRISTTDLDLIVKAYLEGIDSHKELLSYIGLEGVTSSAEFLNSCCRLWGHKYILNETELCSLAAYAGLRSRGKQCFRESEIADLRNLDTIKYSLIIEFEPNIIYPSTKFTEAHSLVSILIPAYRHQYFEQTLLSALNQSYSRVEILVSDDSGDDKIQKIVNSYQNQYSNLFYFKNDPPLGEIKSTQKLMNLSSGKYLQILHDDDFLEEMCIETFVKLMELNPSASLISSAMRVVDSHGNFHSIGNQYFDENMMLSGHTVAYSSHYRINGIAHLGEPSHFMFKREDIFSIGEPFNYILGIEIKVAIDIALHYKLLSLGNWIFVASALSNRRIHDLQSVNDPDVQNQGKISSDLLIKSFSNLGLNNQVYKTLKVLNLEK
jgi:glycosyltransferase involved in cell wall biosynthesis/predicted SAM-dependent methyltransferase